MFEKKTGVAVAFAATAVLVTGCEAAPVVQQQPDAAPSDSAPADAFASDPPDNLGTQADRPFIDTARPPLPAAVAAAAHSVVAVQTKEGQGGSMFGSATVIAYHGLRLVLTAAHVEQDVTTHCRNQNVLYPATSAQPAFAGEVAKASRVKPHAGSEYDPNAYDGNDAAVLVPQDQARLANYPAASVQDKLNLQPGDVMYGVGYSPLHAGMKGPLHAGAAPAITPAFVLQSDGRTVTLMTGVEGYEVADTTVRPGDSGGGLFDADADYAGNIIATSAEPMVGSEIEFAYGVDLSTQAESQAFGIARVNIIDEPRLRAMTQAVKPCTT